MWLGEKEFLLLEGKDFRSSSNQKIIMIDSSLTFAKSIDSTISILACPMISFHPRTSIVIRALPWMMKRSKSIRTPPWRIFEACFLRPHRSSLSRLEEKSHLNIQDWSTWSHFLSLFLFSLIFEIHPDHSENRLHYSHTKSIIKTHRTSQISPTRQTPNLIVFCSSSFDLFHLAASRTFSVQSESSNKYSTFASKHTM